MRLRDIVIGIVICAITVVVFWQPLVNLYVLGSQAAQHASAINAIDKRLQAVEKLIRETKPTVEPTNAPAAG